jgi:dihydroorotase
VSCWNAEERFLPRLRNLAAKHPRLKIVLEHVSTAAGVRAVRELGENVAATVTPQHLALTVDDWAGRNHHYCRPVAKLPSDREAICAAVAEGHPKFFLGSDSAPHPRAAKESAAAPAGVFTSPILLPLLAQRFEELGCLERLEGFACRFGADFYGLERNAARVTLRREPWTVPGEFAGVVPMRASGALSWRMAG